MKRLGMVARADNGGIANQCWQFARRMKPEKILIAHAEHTTRGRAHPERYEFDYGPEIQIAAQAPKSRHVEWLVDGMDTLFTVECWYGPQIPDLAELKGVKTVLQGNPEMTGDEKADVVWAPTPWRLDALPGHPVAMPFPADLDLLPMRTLVGPVQTLYHITSDAMCDRNGTDLLLEACSHINHEVILKIRGLGHERREHWTQIGLVRVEWLGTYQGMFYDAWPQDIDLFVMPRRFGGLSLPMQEAMSLGLPVIALGCEPNEFYLSRRGLIRSSVDSVQNMRGGRFEVHSCDPRALALRINHVIEDAELRRYLTGRSIRWAQAHSWETLMPFYEAELR